MESTFSKNTFGTSFFLIAFWLDNLYLPVTLNDSPAVRKTALKILHPSDWASTLCSASMCPAGGAGDRIEGHH